MFDDHRRVDAAAHVPLGGQAHEARFRGFDQIVEDLVGHGLVEGTFVAVTPHVQLQRLQLDAGLLGHVVEMQRGEIRLSGLRADAGELGNSHVDGIVAPRLRVGEGFQRLRRFRGHGHSLGCLKAGKGSEATRLPQTSFCRRAVKSSQRIGRPRRLLTKKHDATFDDQTFRLQILR